MNFKAISNALTSKVGRQILHVQKHSPKIMFVAGVVGVGATVVLACRATLRVDKILDEHLGNAHLMKEARTHHTDVYSNEDYQKDLVVLHAQTFGKLAKLYGPSIVTGVASIAALTGAHVVLSQRNTGLVASYAALERGFATYRNRVAKDLGMEKEQEYRLGLVDREIVVETEEGPVVKTVKGVNALSGGNPYSFCFDEVSSTSWESSPGYNQLFLSAQERYANQLLQARGHVFLNDVLDSLGMQRTKAGAVTGWIKDSETGDNHIDFGIFRDDEYMGMEFVKGNELSVWLNLNVDGIIYDKI